MSQWFECEKGHKLVLGGDPKKLVKKAARRNARGQPLIVCPHCKPENVSLTPCEPDEQSIVDQYSKKFHCTHGHVTTVYPFATGMCNVGWDGNQENIEADPETMLEFIEEGVVKCPHTKHTKSGDRPCDCKLSPVDDTPLAVPQTHGIKTRTRVGDIWDKYNCPEAKVSQHKLVRRGGQTDAEFHETEFSRRMKRRARDKGIWVFDEKSGKQVKIKKRRVTEKQGDVVDKASKKDYKDKKSRRPKKSDL